MVHQEIVLMILHHVQEGEPKASVARRFGVSRQTVYNHLSASGKRAKPTRPSKLDPFKEYLAERLESYNIPATVLLREIRAMGYTGEISILRDHVREIKRRAYRKLTLRFETSPGRQAQLDWGDCGVIDSRGTKRKLHLFHYELGYSRVMSPRFTTSMKRPELFARLREAFERYGVPRELLVDNMKQLVDTPASGDRPARFNAEFLSFCRHYGNIKPVACHPYWPRTKGKVERGISYIKHSFLEGRRFVDLDDLNLQLDEWVATVANVRIHGTTGERPVDRYERERRHMKPASSFTPYDVRVRYLRKVTSDSHISFGGVRYSVCPDAAGRLVEVRVTGEDPGDRLTAYWDGRIVAEHVMMPRRVKRVTLSEHDQAVRGLTRDVWKGITRRRGVKYLQVNEEDRSLMASVGTPIVEERSLDLYGSLLRDNGK